MKKEKNKLIRLQKDQKFIQNEIKNLHKKYNVQMFSTNVRSGKTYAVEQKIRELKKTYLVLRVSTKKITLE